MLAFIIASWIAFAPSAEPAATEPVDLTEARRLFDEGNARYDAADYEGAIEVFTLALSEVGGQGAGDVRIRALLLFNIGRSHMRAYEINHDVGHLRQARNIFARILDDFIGEVDEDELAEARDRLVEIDSLLAATEPQSKDPEPSPNTVEIELDQPADFRPVRARGIGLTGAGVALLGAGVGMLVWGAGFGPAAESQVAIFDELGLPSDSPGYDAGDEFIALERRKGSAWMAAGGVTAALGVVGVAVGLQQLVRAKKLQQRSLTAGGSFGSDGVWLSVGGRF